MVFTFVLRKRMSHGLSVTGNYSFSKLIEAMQYLNNGDTHLYRMVSPYDHKQHFAMGATYELPIGTGKLIDIKSGVWNSIVGGFKINGVFSFQTGAPLFFSSRSCHHRSTNHRQHPCDSARQGVEYCGIRHCQCRSVLLSSPHALPYAFGNVRTDGINQWDASLLEGLPFFLRACTLQFPL